ncbi:hypothetical protein BHM03_00024593 [Ensete ventricosum]|nr:hypothetical protein BHM03_00024593 [Ensete ventricosum]
MVRLQHARIVALWTANKELKFRASQEVVAGARDNRARLEEDVLSLTEAAALLEKELKAEGPKAAKHPEVEVEAEANPFAECPEDDNVTMDLCQPFDDSTPAEK